MKNVWILALGLCVALVGLTPSDATAKAPTIDLDGAEKGFVRTVSVDCDRGQTIERALRRLGPTLIIEFTGTCTEDVIIDRDNVTLRGAADGATVVGGVRVDASKRVVISDFEVRDNVNLESGIEAVAGASVLIQDMVVDNSVNRGIRVRDSVAEIRDVAVSGSVTAGILIRGSDVTLEGAIDVTTSGEGGIILTDSSSAFSRDGVITANGNLFGVIVQTSSSFEGVFGSLTANNNAVHGLLVASNGAFTYGLTLETNGNGFAGIYVDEGSTMSPFANLTDLASTTATGNAFAGVFVDRNSTFELAGNATISGQVFGVFISTASVLQMTDTTLVGNFAGDLRLDFGVVADFVNEGNTVGTIVCTDDVLTRGDISCP